MPAPPPRTKPDEPVAGAGSHADAGPGGEPGDAFPEARARFRSACETHLDFVWRFARACGVEATSLDYVVHKVFAVLRGRLISLDDASELRVSIAGTTRQVVRAHLRQLSSPRESFAQAQPRPAEELDNVAGLETKSAGELVDLILSAMGETEREIFVLCELEGFSTFETAEALHLSESTVRVRLSDARKIFNDVSARLRAQRFWISRPEDLP
ncbi:MAG TPA: sigma-70 family RNA polymerase sigma factor [Polyangiaceae bacterium]|nr:sigma-70 family RNA polymerase sigma factor [Polyangiaceae bacterium]